jgi:hypothetical protein
MTGVAAIVGTGHLDVLSASGLGFALYSPVFFTPARPANLARFAFLDNRSHQFYPDWDEASLGTPLLIPDHVETTVPPAPATELAPLEHAPVPANCAVLQCLSWKP